MKPGREGMDVTQPTSSSWMSDKHKSSSLVFQEDIKNLAREH
jgi:hypothetical protein